MSSTTFAHENLGPKPMKLLFTMQLHDITFHQTGPGHYQLRVPLSSWHRVLAFTDRPKRQAFVLTPDQYKQLVLQPGKFSFKKIPPNISLSLVKANFDGAFQILSVQNERKSTIYKLKYLPAMIVSSHAIKTANTNLSQLKRASNPPKYFVGNAYLFVDSTLIKTCMKNLYTGKGMIGVKSAGREALSWVLANPLGAWFAFVACAAAG
jgi:hypothetical protein